MNLVLMSRKSTVEIISKQLEYVTKGHVAMQTQYCFKFKRLYSLVPFSSLVL